MGIEFIRASSGKSYKKRWAGGLERANTPGLFDIRMDSTAQVATAALTCQTAPPPGSTVMVQRAGAHLAVFDGMREVAKITNPTASMSSAVDHCNGMVRGVVERLGNLGRTAEIRFS